MTRQRLVEDLPLPQRGRAEDFDRSRRARPVAPPVRPRFRPCRGAGSSPRPEWRERRNVRYCTASPAPRRPNVPARGHRGQHRTGILPGSIRWAIRRALAGSCRSGAGDRNRRRPAPPPSNATSAGRRLRAHATQDPDATRRVMPRWPRAPAQAAMIRPICWQSSIVNVSGRRMSNRPARTASVRGKDCAAT